MRRLFQRIHTVHRLPVLAIFAVFLLVAGHAAAANEAGDKTGEPVPAEVVYPGLEEVVPRASQIDADGADALARLSEIREPDAFRRQFESLQKSWAELQATIERYGAQNQWPINRLLNVKSQVDSQSRTVKQLLDQIALPLKDLEEIRKRWTERLDYWEGWRSSLEKAGARIPRQTFNKVRSSVAEVLARTNKKASGLLKMQEEVSGLREQILDLHEQLDADVATLRKESFRRNAHPLLSVDFFRQINRELGARVVEGLGAALVIDTSFFKTRGWLLGAQILLAIVLIVLFHKIETKTAEKTDDWQFIFQRPISAALFIALATPVLFYKTLPPPLLQLFILVIATIAVARLACQLLQEGNQRTLIYTLAVLFIISKAMTTLAVPLPLYRIYLVIVALAGIPFLYWISHRHQKHFEGRIDRYVFILGAGKLILLITLLAQLSGYATFALRLIDATIGTVFLMLFALMGLRLSEGAIELFFRSQLVSSSRFTKNLGPDATVRFVRLFRVIIWVVAALYLLEVWGVFDDVYSAWAYLMGLEYAIGEFHISVKMIFLVSVVLYLSIMVSWFLQSFLESQVFFGKQIDRGVRDAFKKLSHYALVLAGFVVAMTMAGIKLQNFAILAGAFGIGIGFGLQDIVNNFVSGLILLFERPVKVGDALIIDGQWGAVIKIGMRSTVVETWDRSELIVPNSQMISEKVLNWTLSSNVSRVTIKVGVKYGTDLEKVIKILNNVGDGHAAVVADPAPSAIFTEFGDSSINFELRVWVDDIKNRLSLISDLGVEIDKQFKEAGVEIPFPQRDLHLKTVAADIDLTGQK